MIKTKYQCPACGRVKLDAITINSGSESKILEFCCESCSCTFKLKSDMSKFDEGFIELYFENTKKGNKKYGLKDIVEKISIKDEQEE